MPIYSYRNEETGEVIELLQSINDNHSYEVAGVQWQRVWDCFNIGAAKTDPNSLQQFLDKTNKPGTLGELWDRSAELGHLRAEKNGGVDEIAERRKEKRLAKDNAQVARRVAAIKKSKEKKK